MKECEVMLMRKKWALYITVALLVIAIFSSSAAAYDSYTYTLSGTSTESPAAYTPSKSYSLKNLVDTSDFSADDLFVDVNGTIYISDSTGNRIFLFSNEMELIRILDSFVHPITGESDTFKKPAGTFCDDKGNLYVADTDNARVVVFDKDLSAVSVIGKPEGSGVPSDFVYQPRAVTADKSGRIYVVSKSVTMGVLSFGADGNFEGFMGAQVVAPTAWDLFWRRIMTEKQLSWVDKLIPTEFNNINIDDKGFLYVTTSSLDMYQQYQAFAARSRKSDFAPIRRLNPSGDDVMKRSGFFPPAGDLEINWRKSYAEAVSAMIDVSVGPHNTYVCLDSNNKHVFLYDSDDNLLCAFGKEGLSLGEFSSLTAVQHFGYDLWILDGADRIVTKFSLTEYGQTMMGAIKLKDERKYQESLQKWQEVLLQNQNFEVAQIYIGRMLYNEGKYKEAMDSFKVANDKENYSKAFQKYRSEFLGRFFILVPVLLIAVIILIVLAFKKLQSYNQSLVLTTGSNKKLRNQLSYGMYTIFHPIDGFYEMKTHHRARVPSAILVLAMVVVTIIMRWTGSGYLLSTNQTVGLISVVLTMFLPFILFCIANWCVGSLLGGEANFKTIFITAAYSLIPLVLIVLPLSLLGNWLTLDEMQIFTLLQTVAYVWCFILLFFGTMTVHDYSAGKQVLACFLILLAMAIIAFIGLLFVTLLQRISGFIMEAMEEIIYRI